MRKTLAAAFAALLVGIGLVWTQPTEAWLAQAPPSGPVTLTWNPADKNVGITLSGGNLTATVGGSAQLVRATGSDTTALCYYEVAASQRSSNWSTGFALASLSVSTTYLGATFASVGVLPADGIYINNSLKVALPSYTLGNAMGIAYDGTHQKIWARMAAAGNWNNDVIGNQNPATNTGGVDISGLTAGALFPAFDATTSGDNATANFGGSAYTGTPPSGFGNC